MHLLPFAMIGIALLIGFFVAWYRRRNVRRPPKPFPLLKLPYLAIKEVSSNMDLLDVTILSTCSKDSLYRLKSICRITGARCTMSMTRNWFAVGILFARRPLFQLSENIGNAIPSGAVFVKGNYLQFSWEPISEGLVEKISALLSFSRISVNFSDCYSFHRGMFTKWILDNSYGAKLDIYYYRLSHNPYDLWVPEENATLHVCFFRLFEKCTGATFYINGAQFYLRHANGQREVQITEGHWTQGDIFSLWQATNFDPIRIDTPIKSSTLKSLLSLTAESVLHVDFVAEMEKRPSNVYFGEGLNMKAHWKWNHSRYGIIENISEIPRQSGARSIFMFVKENDGKRYFHMVN